MASSNPKVAELTSRLTQLDRSDPDDDEDIFAQLEAEIENDDNAALRERGLKELQKEMEKLQQMKSTGHGQYQEITDEREVVRISANEKLCVVHFYHDNFRRCKIMDKHLTKLAPKYFGTRFIRVFVENVPWLVEKLAVKVLPCVVCFIDGVSKARIIGFEDLGNIDDFETATLEWRLLNIGVVKKDSEDTPQIVYGSQSRVRQQIRGRNDDDSDFDLDE
ncbi:GTPase inhibitor [Abortiporus biennis]|nr:GTPase inhibitor [Abortiporus biennis]